MKSWSAGGFDKKKKRMRGFMCQSTMASMVCMSHDTARSSSVVVPKKTSSSQSDDTSSSSACSSATRYLRLVQYPSLNVSQNNHVRRSAAKKASNHPGEQQARSTVESARDNDMQIVVMKVSIHCQGCAEKVRKYLSKMEGITSFSIDVESKRVIVMGHVSPDWVLESLSKVKKAELWTL